MTARLRRRSRPAAALAITSLLLAACGSPAQAPAPHFADGGTELDLRLPATIADLPLTDTQGDTVHLSDFAGKDVVLGDILTLCQEHCPIDTANFVLMAREYAATAPDPSDTVFLSITVDPKRDTPAQLAAYRRLYVGAPTDLPQWKLLTGSRRTLTRLWHALHVYVEEVDEDDPRATDWRTGQRLTFDVEHSDDVFFIDGTGEQRYLFAGQPYTGGAGIPPAMKDFMSGEGRRNEAHGSWTASEGLAVLTWLHGT